MAALLPPCASTLEVAAAQVQAPGAESTLFERTLSGERYHLLASPFMPAENVSWTVVTAAPESDFVGETRRALRTLAVIIVGVTTLQVLLIGLFARRIGSQIRAMSARFRSIRSLQFEELSFLSQQRILILVRLFQIITNRTSVLRVATPSLPLCDNQFVENFVHHQIR